MSLCRRHRLRCQWLVIGSPVWQQHRCWAALPLWYLLLLLLEPVTGRARILRCWLHL